MSRNYKIFAVAWVVSLFPIWVYGFSTGEQWLTFGLFVHFIMAPAAVVTIVVWIREIIKGKSGETKSKES